MPIKKKNPSAKIKIGRPTKYNDDMLPKLIEYGKKGYTLTMMAVELGINKDTLYEWIKKDGPHYNKCFSDVFTTAMELSQAFMEKQGLENMANPKFNSGTFKFWMQRRFLKDWGDVPQININHNTSQELSDNERGVLNTIITNLNNNKNYDTE